MKSNDQSTDKNVDDGKREDEKTVDHSKLIALLDGLSVGGNFTWENANISRDEVHWRLRVGDKLNKRFERPRLYFVTAWKRGIVVDGEMVGDPVILGQYYYMSDSMHVENGQCIWQARRNS